VLYRKTKTVQYKQSIVQHAIRKPYYTLDAKINNTDTAGFRFKTSIILPGGKSPAAAKQTR
jgi:hypothetical protein